MKRSFVAFGILIVSLVVFGTMLVKASSMDPIESKKSAYKESEKEQKDASKEKEDDKTDQKADQTAQKQFGPSASVTEQAAASIAASSGAGISVTDGVVQTVTN